MGAVRLERVLTALVFPCGDTCSPACTIAAQVFLRTSATSRRLTRTSCCQVTFDRSDAASLSSMARLSANSGSASAHSS